MMRFIMRHKRTITRVVALLMLLAIVLTLVLSGCGANPNPRAETRTITVWTYYNGDQLTAFQNLIDEYNRTAGAAAFIRVESQNVGGVTDLEETVLKSARGRVGAEPMPNIFAAYSDLAYAVDELGLLADLSPYFTEEEREAFVPAYLEEGALGDPEAIKIFPVAKSVEVFLLNETEWAPFAKATGASYDDLKTIEGLAETAKAYYEWTDDLTPDVPNDGHAFYGRDSMSNYFFIGAKQLGTTIISVDGGDVTLDFNRATVKKLWDNYYIPHICGYFDMDGRFRSDDIKTGNIIALTGSSTGSTYFPTEVILDDMSTEEIEMTVLPAPQFRGSEPYAVQQGAGFAVADTGAEDVGASVHFLKWLTSSEVNINFSVTSGYLPVLQEANSMEAVRSRDIPVDERMEQLLETAFETVSDNTLYTPPAFAKGTAFRSVLENALSDQAKTDRETVIANLGEGMTLEEATAQFVANEYFRVWYDKTYRKLHDLAR